MVRALFGISFLAFAIFCFAGISAAQTNWTGEYFIIEDGGETVGGSRIYIEHKISVSGKTGGLEARLYSQGYQTSRDIIADGVIDGSRLRFYFREKGPDHVFGDFRKGDLLLTLKYKDGRLLTDWAGFSAVLDQNSDSGKIRFEKQDDK